MTESRWVECRKTVRKFADGVALDAADDDNETWMLEQFWRWNVHIGINSEDSEELASDTLLRVHLKFPQFRGVNVPDNEGGVIFKGWCSAINHSVRTNWWRKESKTRPKTISFDDELLKILHSRALEVDPKPRDSKELRALVLALERLRPDQRELLYLRFVAEMLFVEIAEVLGKSPDAIKKATARAIEALILYYRDLLS